MCVFLFEPPLAKFCVIPQTPTPFVTMADILIPHDNDHVGASSGDASTRSSERAQSLVVRSSQANAVQSWWRYPLMAAGAALFLTPFSYLWSWEAPIDPASYAERTRRVLKSTP